MHANDATVALDHLLKPEKQSSGRAILLTGGWGSGKTFLWKNLVLPGLARPSLYVSAFGAENSAALKTRLLSGLVVGTVSRVGVGNETKAKARGLRDRVKDSMGRPGAALVSIFNSAGNTLLKKADIDPLQLLEFIDKRTVICIDDIERVSPSFAIQDVLAISNYLTEHKGFDVVLISNEEQIGRDSAEAKAAYLRYKEKTVHREIQLVADIPSVFERVLTDLVRSKTGQEEIRKGREIVLETFRRAGEQNIRVLGRAFSSIELLASFGVTALSPEHLRLLCSFTILSGRGEIRPSEFYAFNPLVVRISEHMVKGARGASGTPPDESKDRLAFLERYFCDGDYSYDSEIYRLVCRGEVDVAHFQELSAPRTQPSPAEQLVQRVASGGWRYWSDEQVKELVTQIVGLLRSSPPLHWRATLELLAYCRLLAEIIHVELPTDLGPRVVEALSERMAKESPTTLLSLDREWEMHLGELSEYVKEEMAVVKREISRTQRTEIQNRLIASIDAGDLSAFQSLLGQDTMVCSEILFDQDGLERLLATRKTSAHFFVSGVEVVLHELKTWSGTSPALQERREALLTRLKSLVEDSKEDFMARWRLGFVVRPG